MTDSRWQASRRVILTGAGASILAACSDPGSPSGQPSSGKDSQPSSGATGKATGGQPGATWIAKENAETGAKWTISRVATDDELSGYASTHSLRPGDPLSLHISSPTAKIRIGVYRLGYYKGVGSRRVWQGQATGVQKETATKRDSKTGMVSCSWPARADLDTSDWPEGSYLIRISTGSKSTDPARLIPLTVRSQSTRGRVVLVSATTTYAAYNEWGGASLYYGKEANGERTFEGRARVVSLARPEDENGAKIVTKYEVGPVFWIEKVASESGINLAYVSNLDMHDDPKILSEAAAVIVQGHDEYWSVAMRTQVAGAIKAGSNLAVLGANTCYWRVRVDTGERIVTCYKSATEDPVQGAETTAMWRSAPQSEPENSLVGMLYEAFPATGPMVVHDPTFFAFKGAGVAAGTKIPGLVGPEIDRAYPIASTPENLQVVAHSPVPLAGGGSTFADATYWSDPSGAGVFAVGTMAWAMALRDRIKTDEGHTVATQKFARTVTANVVQAMAKGPVARQHPPRPNLDKLGASAKTSTGTGGEVDQ